MSEPDLVVGCHAIEIPDLVIRRIPALECHHGIERRGIEAHHGAAVTQHTHHVLERHLVGGDLTIAIIPVVAVRANHEHELIARNDRRDCARSIRIELLTCDRSGIATAVMLVEQHRENLIDSASDLGQIPVLDRRGDRIGDCLAERMQHGLELARERHRHLVQVREIVSDLEVDEYARETIRFHDLRQLLDGACPRRRSRQQRAQLLPTEFLGERVEVADHEQQPRALVDRFFEHARHCPLPVEGVEPQRVSVAGDERPLEHNDIELLQVRVERRVRVVVPIDVEATDEWRADGRSLLTIRWYRRHAIDVSGRGCAARGCQRLLKSTLGEQPRAL